MTPVHVGALVASGFGAGVMNALAGGGTILTFPALLLLGESAIVANATSTVALLPGAAASMVGYRREVRAHRWWLRTLLLPSVIGGAVGAVLLLRTPERTFANLAPLLILFATALFMIQGVVRRRAGAVPASGERPSGARWTAAVVAQLAVAIYGGYFGAGIGILMLALLAFLGLSDIHAMNGLKNFFGLCINGLATLYFVVRGAVDWPAALWIGAGAIAGGFAGAYFARRIGQGPARAAVVAIGLFLAAALFWQRLAE
jgi:uncharacterized protein